MATKCEVRQYFVAYSGKCPKELNDILMHTPLYTKNCVIVETNKSMDELNKIKGVRFVERADTGKLNIS